MWHRPIQNYSQMKRRNFLSTAGITVAAGTTATGAVASSVFNNISSNLALQEFSDAAQETLKTFKTDLHLNFENHPQKNQFVKQISSPVRIISKSKTGKNEFIIYKNTLGNFIKIFEKNGLQQVYISNNWID